MQQLLHSPVMLTGISLAVGLFAGWGLWHWIVRLTQGPPPHRLSRVVTILLTGGLFAAYAWAMFAVESQTVVEVQPFAEWKLGRLPYHLTLLALMVAATGTDLRDYEIPDAITVPGMLIGMGVAFASGDVQIIHIWVDWNDSMTEIHGPLIPDWVKNHQHWHGLAWSVSGLVVGAGATWIIRIVSSFILGRPALGFGDVTLMAMIGSFIGWQPAAFVLLLTPACALVFGIVVRLVTGRTFVAYGPYICAATVLVLFTWKWLWVPLRDVFGHPPSLLFITAISLVALVVLTLMLRGYQAIPVRRMVETSTPDEDEHSSLARDDNTL